MKWRLGKDEGNDDKYTYTFSTVHTGFDPVWLREYQDSLRKQVQAAARPKPSSAFAGDEFAMGTAVGVRSWDVDRLGRLLSPQYRMVWSPDEVVAECRVKQASGGIALRYYLDAATADTEQPEPAKEHRQADCSCGFYAYYEGFNEYADDARITGVIEGYGETQIGTRGFKSAKARIVALYVPESNSMDEDRIGPSLFERVRTNYGPHVAIFDDYGQMLAEFPTTQPENSTPDTDPDFWTRSI